MIDEVARCSWLIGSESGAEISIVRKILCGVESVAGASLTTAMEYVVGRRCVLVRADRGYQVAIGRYVLHPIERILLPPPPPNCR